MHYQRQFLANKCHFRPGPGSSVEERSLRKKVLSRQTVVQISLYAKSFSCVIYSQMHDPKASKHVEKYLATSQLETKLAAVDMQPLSEREM